MNHTELLVRKPLETGQNPTSEEELRIARELYMKEDNRFLQERLDVRRLPYVLDKLGRITYTKESVDLYQKKVREEDHAAVLAGFNFLNRMFIRADPFAVGWALFLTICAVLIYGGQRGLRWSDGVLVACLIALWIYHAWITPDFRGWHWPSLKHYKGEVSPEMLRTVFDLKRELPTVDIYIEYYGREEEPSSPTLGTETFLCIRASCGDNIAKSYYLAKE